jgi:hypothetical protein
MGLIACHTLPDHRFWHNWRLPGNPFYFSRRWPTVTEHLPACPDDYVWPLRKLVALHVQEEKIIQETIRNVTFMSPDLAYYVAHRREWRLCRGNATSFAAITGREELRKWTPPLLFRKGGQRIAWRQASKDGPSECAQCTGVRRPMRQSEDQRIALWNRTGWSHSYELVSQR